MPSKWAIREQVILDAVANLSEQFDPSSEAVKEATGLPDREFAVGLRSLYEAEYLTGLKAWGLGELPGSVLLEIRLLERGLIATGVWPGDAYDELVARLTEAIEKESNPEQRSRLQRLLAAVGDVGKGVATSVLTDVIKRTAGLP